MALGTVYLLWGSTYLGIEIAGETIPPLFAVGTRFLAAAALMFAFTAWRRGAGVVRVTGKQLLSCALIGALLPGANAILFVAERHVPTGVAALIFGSVPLWIVLMRTLTGDRPHPAAPPPGGAPRRRRRLRRARASRAAERPCAALGAPSRRRRRGHVGGGIFRLG